MLELIRSHLLALPNLAKFALGMAIIVGVPRVSKSSGSRLLWVCCFPES